MATSFGAGSQVCTGSSSIPAGLIDAANGTTDNSGIGVIASVANAMKYSRETEQ